MEDNAHGSGSAIKFDINTAKSFRSAGEWRPELNVEAAATFHERRDLTGARECRLHLVND
jgi:hypothetical protein